MAKMQIFFGGVLQAEHPLEDRTEWKVGRSAECDIVIDNLGVSRHHCTLFQKQREWYVADNHSSNGTFVNGERIGERVLNHQDRVVLGKHTLFFNQFAKGRGEDITGMPSIGDFSDSEAELEDATMMVGRKAQVQFQHRSEKEKAMVLALEGRARITVPMEKNVIVIGKGRHCDLRISGFLVRDEEIHIVKQRSYYKAIQQGGWRQMQVNGEKTRETVLQTGDVLTIAGNRISFGSL